MACTTGWRLRAGVRSAPTVCSHLADGGGWAACTMVRQHARLEGRTVADQHAQLGRTQGSGNVAGGDWAACTREQGRRLIIQDWVEWQLGSGEFRVAARPLPVGVLG